MEGMIPFGNHPIFRYLFGWTLPPKYSLLKYLRTTFLTELARDQIETLVCQDFIIDVEHLKDSLEFFDKSVKMGTVWLCPTKRPVPKGPEDFENLDKDGIKIDIGLYGYHFIINLEYIFFILVIFFSGCLLKDYHPVKTQKQMEDFTIKKKGFIGLYAESQLTLGEFKTMIGPENDNLYDSVRKRFDCERAFPHRYEKISNLGRKSLSKNK